MSPKSHLKFYMSSSPDNLPNALLAKNMGNKCPQPPCEPEIIPPIAVTMSDGAIERLQRGKATEFAPIELEHYALESNAQYYMATMRCMQDDHSKQKELTVDSFNNLYERVSKRIQSNPQVAEKERAALAEDLKCVCSILEVEKEQQEIDKLLMGRYKALAAKYASKAHDDVVEGILKDNKCPQYIK